MLVKPGETLEACRNSRMRSKGFYHSRTRAISPSQDRVQYSVYRDGWIVEAQVEAAVVLQRHAKVRYRLGMPIICR